MSPRPTSGTCNSCGRAGDPSREHLIHVAVGRVILGNRGFSADEVRRRLQDEYHSAFRYYGDVLHGEPGGPAFLNQHIRGLICRDCNAGWAKTLEEDAGANLHDFTMLRGPADARLLRRWAWWFAIKMWFMGTRPEGLAGGPLRPALEKLADPGVDIEMPVVLARTQGSPRLWNIAGLAQGWRGADTPFIAWVIRGVVWMVCATDQPNVVLPIPVTPLTPDLRLHRVRTLQRRHVVALFSAPPAELPDRLGSSARDR